MTMTITIADARPNDIKQMLTLSAQLFKDNGDEVPDTDTHSRGLWLMLDGCGKHRTVKLARKGDKIVGMCSVQSRISMARGNIAAEIENLVVDEQYRCQGIGSQLLEAVDDWARKKGICSLYLRTDTADQRALCFFSTRNWTPTEQVCLAKPV